MNNSVVQLSHKLIHLYPQISRLKTKTSHDLHESNICSSALTQKNNVVMLLTTKKVHRKIPTCSLLEWYLNIVLRNTRREGAQWVGQMDLAGEHGRLSLKVPNEPSD